MPNDAAKDTKLKLGLEEKLRPLLVRYNNSVVRKFVQVLGLQANVFDVHTMDTMLGEILLRHYNRVSEVFTDNFGLNPTEGEEQNILLALLIFFTEESKKESILINNTTSRNMVDSVTAARLDPLVVEFPDNRTLATVAGANLNRKLSGRVNGILTSATQLSSESAKLTEAQILAGVDATVSGGSARVAGVKKEWVTVGDNRVRPAHMSADGQRVDINKPFIVGGEALMVPRDRSRGASLGNTMGCRCSAEYDIEDIENLR